MTRHRPASRHPRVLAAALAAALLGGLLPMPAAVGAPPDADVDPDAGRLPSIAYQEAMAHGVTVAP